MTIRVKTNKLDEIQTDAVAKAKPVTGTVLRKVLESRFVQSFVIVLGAIGT